MIKYTLSTMYNTPPLKLRDVSGQILQNCSEKGTVAKAYSELAKRLTEEEEEEQKQNSSEGESD